MKTIEYISNLLSIDPKYIVLTITTIIIWLILDIIKKIIIKILKKIDNNKKEY